MQNFESFALPLGLILLGYGVITLWLIHCEEMAEVKRQRSNRRTPLFPVSDRRHVEARETPGNSAPVEFPERGTAWKTCRPETVVPQPEGIGTTPPPTSHSIISDSPS